MSTSQAFVWSSVVLSLALYCPLILGIKRDKIKQSVATWGLWVMLDSIALASIIFQKGNYLLLVYKKLFMWTRFETFVLILVVMCLIIWSLSGSKWATISSTIAVCIAGCPQIRDSWRKPDRNTAQIYSGYVFANCLYFLAGKSWTIEERFYPGMMTLLCIAIAGTAFKKKKSEPEAVC